MSGKYSGGASMTLTRRPGAAKRREVYLRREEARWARQSGKTTTTRVDPDKLEDELKARHLT